MLLPVLTSDPGPLTACGCTVLPFLQVSGGQAGSAMSQSPLCSRRWQRLPFRYDGWYCVCASEIGRFVPELDVLVG